MGVVPAAHAWASNAELIADVAKLGYISDQGPVLDPTYGRGLWWKEFCPPGLLKADINPKFPDVLREDFTSMGWADDSFDTVAFDPPYVAPGGRKTSTITDFNDRFGLHTTPRRPEDLQLLINAGITEIHRVLKPKGVLLVKCKDYINAARLFPGTHYTILHAVKTGFRYEDRFEHLGSPGPQPPRKTQQHARRAHSTLLVFRKWNGGDAQRDRMAVGDSPGEVT